MLWLHGLIWQHIIPPRFSPKVQAVGGRVTPGTLPSPRLSTLAAGHLRAAEAMSCWNGQCTPEKKGSTGTCWGGSKFGINLQDSATFQGFLSHLHSLLLFSVCSPPNFRMYFAPVHEISPAEDGVVAAHWCTFSHPQKIKVWLLQDGCYWMVNPVTLW